jgi:pilus assembly protein FimV
MKIRRVQLAVAIGATLAAPMAHALGLGQITVRSGLNEPLRAEIPLLEVGPEELPGVQTRLASAADFARVGLSASNVPVPLEFAVVTGAGGRPAISVTSRDPVREPLVSVLIEVNWANGRLLREYNILLDPPRVAPAVAAPAPPVARPAATTAPAAPEPAPAPVQPVARAPAPSPSPSAAAPAPAAARSARPDPTPAAAPPAPSRPDRVTVQSGDTLWEIAQANRPRPAITVDQMMIAIQRENPQAFIGGNINRLRRGATLAIPEESKITELSPAAARAEVQAQVAALAAPRPMADARAAPTPTPPTPPRQTDADSRLEVLPPRSGTDGRGAAGERAGAAGGTDPRRVAQLDADLKRAQEQVATRDQEVRELRTRVSDLEKIDRDRQSLVALKDTDLAALRQQLQQRDAELERLAARVRELEAAKVAADATPAPAPVAAASAPPSVESVPAEVVAVEEAPAAPAEAVSQAEAAEASTAAEPPAVAEVPPAEGVETAATGSSFEAESVAAEAVPTEPAPAEPAAAAPVAGAAPEPAPVTAPWWQQPIMLVIAGGAALLLLIAGIVSGRRRKAAAAASAATGTRSSVAEAFSDESGDEEAGDSSEQRLLEYLATAPNDLDAHLELLRIYREQGDLERFETAANAMYAQVYDPMVSQWQEALGMGRELLPDHPLFAEAGFLESPAPAQAFEPGDRAEEWETLEEHADSPEAWTQERDSVAADPALAADHASSEPSLELEPQRASPWEGLDEVKVSTVDIRPFEQPKPSEVSLDVDFDLEPAPHGEAERGVTPFAEDLIGTKLDLARAYVDMGDLEGARSMLEEVIAEGAEVQRQEARRLLDSLG